MRTEKQNKADRLYRAVGGIDDRYLAEALECAPKAQKKGKVLRMRTVITLVAAVLCLVIVGAVIAGRITEKKAYDKLTALEKAFPREEKAGEFAGSVNLHGGSSLLVWKYAGSDQTYSRRISSSQFTKLQNCQKNAERVGESSDETVRVWLCDAGGNVTTPFLLDSQGNVSDELFEYEPELVVTEETVTFLQELFT